MMAKSFVGTAPRWQPPQAGVGQIMEYDGTEWQSVEGQNAYHVEDYGAVGYLSDPGSSRVYSDDAILAVVAEIKASGRGGVIQFDALTYFIQKEIFVDDVPGIEFRGLGGHYAKVNATTEGQIATIHCLDDAEHVFHVRGSAYNSSIKFSNLVIKGVSHSGEDTAAIFFDDSLSWMPYITIDNCWISDKKYGLVNNLEGVMKGIGVFEMRASRITSCWWGIHLDIGTNTTMRIHHSEIRWNGHAATPEENFDTVEQGGGIWIRGFQAGSISQCNLESNSTGIRLYASRGTSISNNYFENNKTCAINLESCHGVKATAQYGHNLDSSDNTDLFRVKNCEGVDFSIFGGTETGRVPFDSIIPRIQDDGGNSNIQSRSGKTYLSAVPVEGLWTVGDVVHNSAPVAGGHVGWVCVVTGEPGEWKPFGSIEG